MINGVTMGFLWLVIDGCYALGILALSLSLQLFSLCYFLFFIIGFWYGAKLFRDGEYNLGDVIIVSLKIKRGIYII
jgi:hypothetical protein